MLSLFSILLLSQQVSSIGTVDNMGIWTRNSILEGIERYNGPIDALVQRRQLPGGPGISTPGMSPSISGMNLTEWDAMTKVACVESLGTFNGKINNPSGMAVCYNLPFLDNSTGVFEADLRLYMVANPSGGFINIAADKVEVGLTYDGATVTPVNASSLRRRVEDRFIPLASWPKEGAMDVAKRAMTPRLIESYAFVGQINKTLLPTMNDQTALQKVLIPMVTISALDVTGATINTSLSKDEITFVNGVFSGSVLPTKATLAPPIQTLVVSKDAAFIVPGLNILIFPIGLIITGLWTIAFVSTVSYGTFRRTQHRDEFREKSFSSSRDGLMSF
ncbi:Bgt-3757 [Blumeria graminis f. sp. tritici]|uniref:Bgt-3757 n=3 Tax=Blumeria graminis TaxID=34373 RepID=A0A9X9QCT1_BLUGR|nr:Bgt-3757 [Blumeria graminis f. sp. tritici]